MTVELLSEELTRSLFEAQKLLNLKAEFGRLPAGPFKDQALKRIEGWFNGKGEGPRERVPEYTDHPELLKGVGDREDPAAVEAAASVFENEFGSDPDSIQF